MRKSIKPFRTEYKSRKPAKPAALFDEFDVQASDERPSRDINEDMSLRYEGSYEEALRAADVVFGGTKQEASVDRAGDAIGTWKTHPQ